MEGGGGTLVSLGGAPSLSHTPTLDSTRLFSGQCLMVESLVATQTPAMLRVSTILSLGELSLHTRKCLSDCLRSVRKMLASLPLGGSPPG